MMFQSMSAYIYFSPESHKWTPKPTFKKRVKKEPKLFRILYPVKKQVTSHLKLQRVFLQKHVGVPWANTVRVVFLCNVVSEGSIQHCIGYFSHMGNITQVISLCNVGSDRSTQNCNYFFMQCCLWTVGQHCTSKFSCNIGSGRSKQHCSIAYLPVKRWLCALG